MKTNYLLFIKFCLLMIFSASTGYAQDKCEPVGWATQNGGVTGGGNATPVVVSTYSELDDAVDDEDVKVIHISGTITIPSGGRISFQDQSNKSILGLPGARLVSNDQSSGGSGILQIKRVDNAIIRNITFEGPGAYDVDGNDNLTVEDSRNLWVDHCVFEDGCDGNFDIKSEANYISVTWCIFRYRKPPRSGGPGGSDDHRYSNLIGSSDSKTQNRGKLNVTFQYCQWGEGVRERMPRIRFGKVHMVNNLFNSDVDNYGIRAGYEADIRVEGNYFDDQDEPIDYFDDDYTAVYANNNTGLSNVSRGSSVFNPPYSIDIANPNDIVDPILNCAGATLNGPNGCSTCSGGGGSADCNGDVGGSAYLDDCNRCVGGNSGAAPCATTLQEGVYRIHPVHSNLCMANNNPSTQENCSQTAEQYWQVIKDGQNYQIKSLDNDQYLSPGSGVQGESTGMSSSAVALTLADAGNGNFYLQPNNNPSLVFDILNISTEVNMEAILWENTGADNQKFRFESVNVQLDCNGDINGSASLDACGVCSGGNTGAEACSGSIQGEEYCEINGVQEAENGGFQGNGYANFTNENGSSGTWKINSNSAQNATLGFRYANGGTINRNMNVIVNGNQQTSLTFATTAGWTTWNSESITVNLNAGINTIQLVSTTQEGGPNLDLISLNSSGLSAASCDAVADCNGDIGGSAYLDDCNECVGGETGNEACSPTEYDCNGDENGSAYLDNCNECVGGETGKEACTVDCNGTTPKFGLIGYASGTTGGQGGTEVTVSTGLELQDAISNANGPTIIYVEGVITPANSGSLSKIDIKDVQDISIIGDLDSFGEIDGIGLKVWRASNIIIQNLKIHNVLIGDKDAISIEGPSNNIWVDHCELYSEYQTVGKDYYDGLLDLKRDVSNVTFSWNYLHDSWKASLSGSSESDTDDRNVTYHHNFYENINSRLPLFRSGRGHVFNNYYKDVYSTGINSRMNACIKIEGNYFENVNNPYVSAYSDVVGYGDISDDNILVNSPFSYSDDTRELGSCTANIPYEYQDYVNCPESITTIVPQYSGVGKLGNNPTYPPVVSIINPKNNTEFEDGDNVNITVDASDADGSITKVEFFNGNEKLGEDVSSPYYFNWRSISEGTFTLRVVATNNEGVTVSDEVTLIVTASAEPTDCNGDVNGTAYLDDCDVCVGGNTGFEPCAETIQGEEACYVDGILLESENANYEGAGYANTENLQDVAISWEFTANTAATITVTARYANGGTTDRSGDIYVNGTATGTTIDMPTTGGWDIWNTVTFTIQVIAGPNELKFIANSAEGLANLDALYFSDGINNSGCIITDIFATDNASGIEVYPNPFRENIKINTPNEFQYRVLSSNGAVVEESTCNGNCSLGENLDNGVYILEIQQATGLERIKMLKN